MQSSHSTNLPFHGLSENATCAHIFPALATANLLSIGQLCDDGCTATFTHSHLRVTKDNKTILTGTRNHTNGMWYVPLHNRPSPKLEFAHVTTPLHPISKLIKFLHSAAFSPSISTWTKAVQAGFFATWPELTAKNIAKYLPKSIPTAMGHLDQERKNLRSTQPAPEPQFEKVD